MKSVLISIQPKWCELIAGGQKTVEVRKTQPKMATPFKVYIYQTLHRENNGHTYSDGKVIGEFICRNIDYYDYDQAFDESMGCYIDKYGYDITAFELGQTCLSYEEFEKYGNTNRLYGWNISNLVIYDKPKYLSEFYQKCKSYDKDEFEYDDCLECENTCGNGGKLYLKRPPQSWCYVEGVDLQ